MSSSGTCKPPLVLRSSYAQLSSSWKQSIFENLRFDHILGSAVFQPSVRFGDICNVGLGGTAGGR